MKQVQALHKAWQDITDLFIKKYFTTDDGVACVGSWVCGDIGDIFDVDAFFFNGHDIITALELDVPLDVLIDWYNETHELYKTRTECKECHQLKPVELNKLTSLTRYYNAKRP